jgi:hypothetical protein
VWIEHAESTNRGLAQFERERAAGIKPFRGDLDVPQLIADPERHLQFAEEDAEEDADDDDLRARLRKLQTGFQLEWDEHTPCSAATTKAMERAKKYGLADGKLYTPPAAAVLRKSTLDGSTLASLQATAFKKNLQTSLNNQQQTVIKQMIANQPVTFLTEPDAPPAHNVPQLDKKQPLTPASVCKQFGLNEEQQLAFQSVADTLDAEMKGQIPAQKLLFLGGHGGTGKTRVVQAIKAWFDCNQRSSWLASGAYTGVAAHLIKGRTLHSWLSLGLNQKKKSAAAKKKKGSEVNSHCENVNRTAVSGSGTNQILHH